MKDKIDNEVEYLGYTTITDQRFDKEDWYILDTLGTYNNIYLLYNLRNGTSQTIKITKTQGQDWQLPPKHHIIRVYEYTNRNKKKLDHIDAKGRKHFVDTDERERVISKYSILS